MEADLVLLRSFLLVAEEGHFGRAARRLYVSQPTLSRRIAALEQQLGALFVRTPRGAELTPAGQLLDERLPRLLAGLSDLLRDVAREQVFDLTIATLGPALSEHTSTIVNSLERREPGLRVHFRSYGYLEHLQCLLSGEVDIAFLWLGAYDDGELAGVELAVSRTEPRAVLLPQAHPLATATSLRTTEVLAERFIDDVPGMPAAWRAYWMLDEFRGSAPCVHEPAPRNAEEKLRMVMVMAGHGITIMPSSVAKHYQRAGLRAILLIDAPGATLAVAQRANDHRRHVSAAARTLAKVTGNKPG